MDIVKNEWNRFRRMNLQYVEVREQICDVCHKIWQLDLVAANDGNVSAKLPDGNFFSYPRQEFQKALSVL